MSLSIEDPPDPQRKCSPSEIELGRSALRETLRESPKYRVDDGSVVKFAAHWGRHQEWNRRLIPCSTRDTTTQSQREHSHLTKTSTYAIISNRRGGMDVTMSGFIFEPRWGSRRPTPGALRNSIYLNGSSFPGIPLALGQSLSNFGASFHLASVQSPSSGRVRGYDNATDHRKFLIQELLRFCQKGRSSSPQSTRISSGFLSGNLLAIKGDALIHGPSLVARPVGSEWRIHRLFHRVHPINYRGDQL